MNYFGNDWDLIETLTIQGKLGFERNENGTILIGHDPTVAPKAYRHIVYAPLESEAEQELVNRSTRCLSTCVLEFLRSANGMMLNFGDLRVLGYVPVNRNAKNTIHNYPPNIIAANYDVKDTDSLRVGYYKKRNSYVILSGDGEVRFDDRESRTKQQSVWADYRSWIISESQRLAKF